MIKAEYREPVSVQQFGVFGDGLRLDTEVIQQAIDHTSHNRQELVFGRGLYLTGTLVLRSHTRIKLEQGAVLLGSADFADYMSDIHSFVDAVNQERGRCLIYGDHVEDVKIYGEGTINGRGGIFGDDHPEHKRRPFLCRFVGCKDLELEGIQVINSAAWCTHFLDCENVRVSGITIRSRVNHNNDGMDIDCCRGFLVENCMIDTGDDGICLKATMNKPCRDIHVRNCTITSRWAAFKIGTESYGDFGNVVFEDSSIFDTEGCGIKIVPVDGAHLTDVRIENITMTRTTGPVFIALGERLRTYFKGDSPRPVGSMRNITIRGLKADVVDADGFAWDPGPYPGFVTHDGIWGNGKGGVVVSGIPSSRMENVTLQDWELQLPGGVSQYDRDPADIIEMGANYPEFHVFGRLPGYGMFLRHIDGLTVDHIRIGLKEKDCRPETVEVDVLGKR